MTIIIKPLKQFNVKKHTLNIKSNITRTLWCISIILCFASQFLCCICLSNDKIKELEIEQFCIKDNPDVIRKKLENGFEYAIYGNDDITDKKHVYILW
jgi:hypothetical protein